MKLATAFAAAEPELEVLVLEIDVVSEVEGFGGGGDGGGEKFISAGISSSSLSSGGCPPFISFFPGMTIG